jgi:hypothetical protein
MRKIVVPVYRPDFEYKKIQLCLFIPISTFITRPMSVNVVCVYDFLAYVLIYPTTMAAGGVCFD